MRPVSYVVKVFLNGPTLASFYFFSSFLRTLQYKLVASQDLNSFGVEGKDVDHKGSTTFHVATFGNFFHLEKVNEQMNKYSGLSSGAETHFWSRLTSETRPIFFKESFGENS